MIQELQYSVCWGYSSPWHEELFSNYQIFFRCEMEQSKQWGEDTLGMTDTLYQSSLQLMDWSQWRIGLCKQTNTLSMVKKLNSNYIKWMSSKTWPPPYFVAEVPSPSTLGHVSKQGILEAAAAYWHREVLFRELCYSLTTWYWCINTLDDIE